MCPIEIYAYSNTPMRTFHETSNKNLGEPIRLSYHGQSHFNSIVKINANFSMNRGNEPFGVREETAIRKAKIRKDQVNIEEKELRIVRVEFENKGNRDLETTLQESLVAFEDSIKKISVRTFENVNIILVILIINSKRKRMRDCLYNKQLKSHQDFLRAVLIE